MAGTSEPAALPARPRSAWWRRGVPQTQTAYVAIAFAVLIVVISILAPVFMTPRNLLNISKNFSFIALMSLGETLVIISGGIDLSVGSICALSAVVTLMLMRFLSATAAAQVPGATIALATLLALALAALIGLVNGLLIARIRLSPFVTTLGMLSVARGMTYVLTQGRAQYPTGPDVAGFTRSGACGRRDQPARPAARCRGRHRRPRRSRRTPRIRASASAAGTTCDAGLRHSRQSRRPRAAARCLHRRRLSAG